MSLPGVGKDGTFSELYFRVIRTMDHLGPRRTLVDPHAYRVMARTEEEHWWFGGRRAIVANIIETMRLPKRAAILEIGAGTGGNLGMLAKYGEVQALEPDAFSRELATKKSGIQVVDGKLPDHIPFSSSRFDLICLLDVLEHVENDVASLRAINRFLLPGGKICITVPAHQWLWSTHDEHLHHFRRYSKAQLLGIVSEAGQRVTKMSYFNTLLFPLAVAVRMGDRWVGKKPSGTGVPPSWANVFLKHVLYAEAALLKRSTLPFGISLIAVIESGH